MYTEPKVNKYKIVDYFDVWGNPIDGWEVNNLTSYYDTEDTCLRIAEDATDEEIIDLLERIGYLTEEANRNEAVYLDSQDDMMIEIIAEEDDFPLGRLEMIG